MHYREVRESSCSCIPLLSGMDGFRSIKLGLLDGFLNQLNFGGMCWFSPNSSQAPVYRHLATISSRLPTWQSCQIALWHVERNLAVAICQCPSLSFPKQNAEERRRKKRVEKEINGTLAASFINSLAPEPVKLPLLSSPLLHTSRKRPSSSSLGG